MVAMSESIIHMDAGVAGPGEFLFGVTPVMLDLKKKIALVAHTDVPVLITGESGTGKETLAVEIHRMSKRGPNPFVKVNCAAIPDALMESELFGFERGAFTGAVQRRIGKFEQATTGTIFLDEIADLDLGLQAKLLHVLQDGNLAMIGSSEEVILDTRVICATNRDMPVAVQAGQFRQDLYYRINVIHVILPPLRQRRADLPELVNHFLLHYYKLFNRPVTKPSAALMELFGAYHWPGNIRELENILKQFVILQNEGELIRTLEAKLREELQRIVDPDGTVPLKKYVKLATLQVEKELILKVLRHNRWNRKKSARMLKISYRALLYKLKECGLDQRETAVLEKSE
jgi:two-component system, NtrC family, response regulator AtoC